MCGIAGLLLNKVGSLSRPAREIVTCMSERIAHRGPDGHGLWLDDQGLLGLAQRRLAIVDLSPTGSQPMTSHCGRFVIVFNGEIYNHIELRKRLNASDLRGTSDTEVLLQLIACAGFEEALSMAVGMFAICLWDKQDRRLILARDRCGEKPLYFCHEQWGMAFSSELSSFSCIPGLQLDIDPIAVADFLRTGCIPSPRTVFKSVQKLQPGTLIEFSRPEHCWEPTSTKQFWSPDFSHLQADQSSSGTSSLSLAVPRLKSVLQEAVASQMVADVPVGCFLSGGIDSSLTASLMQSISPGKVETFTIGFQSPEYDESPLARDIADHLGTNHFMHRVTERELLDLVPELSRHYSEPFADASQIPTILLARFARQRVKVALSGDGADELFGGYNRHTQIQKLLRLQGAFPSWLSKALLRKLDGGEGSRAGAALLGILKRVQYLNDRQMGDKLHKMVSAIAAESNLETYMKLVSSDGSNVDGWTESAKKAFEAGDTALSTRIMHADFLGYMHDDVLTKVDRATMSAGLESRAPFLDHRVVEFAHRLPTEFCVRDGVGKIILRELLSEFVPRHMFERPKKGFAVPMNEWLKGPLRDWAEDLIRSQTILDDALLRSRWNVHLAGARNWKDWLWPALMLADWHRRYRTA